MKKYLVIEIQANADGTVGNLVYCYDTREEAESKWHGILSAAALSNVECHTAVMFSADGEEWQAQHYEHKELA